MDFSEALAVLVGDALADRPANDSLADMIADLAMQLGNVVAVTAGGDPVVISAILTGCKDLSAESAARTADFFNKLVLVEEAE